MLDRVIDFFRDNLADNYVWLMVVGLAILWGMDRQKVWSRRRWRNRRGGRTYRPQSRVTASGSAPEPAAPFDSAQQLRVVEQARFERRSIMNRSEMRVFSALERACADHATDWRVMAQVSLGEILASPDAEAYRAINSKRVDLLIVREDGRPLHAFEYQGTGHHIGPAATRDAIKREALRKAGIGYHEVMPGDSPAELRARIARLRRAADEVTA